MQQEPPDPGLTEDLIKIHIEKYWIEKNEELEASIDFEVSKRLEGYTKPLVDQIKLLEERLVMAEKELHELKTKNMTFGDVATKTRLFESGASLAAPQSFTRTRSPSPATRSGATGSAPAPRPPPRPRRPSTTTYTEDISIDEVRRNFRECKKQIRISPITLEHIRCMYVGLTNDTKPYPDSVIATGESHAEARLEAARDYFTDELNMEEHQFAIDKVEYMGNDKATMIVTMKDEKFVARAFMRKAAVRNNTLKVTNSWPNFSFQRRRAIFDLIVEAKSHIPDSIYQARPGAQDIEIYEKHKGGFFHSIPLNLFLDMMGTTPEAIPGFYKAQEKSRGRNLNKRGPPTPEQANRAAAQRHRTGEESTEEREAPTAETGEDSRDTTGDTEGEDGSIQMDGESQTGEKTNSNES